MIFIPAMLFIMLLMSVDMDHGTDYADRFVYAISTAQEGRAKWN